MPAALLWLMAAIAPTLGPARALPWAITGALALLLRRRFTGLAACALLSLAWVEHSETPRRGDAGSLDLARPVTAELDRVRGWRQIGWAWLAEGRVRRLEQGGRAVRAAPLPVTIRLTAEGEPPDMRSAVARGYLEPPSTYRNGRTRRVGGWRLAVKSVRFIEPIGDAPAPSPLRRPQPRLGTGERVGPALAYALLLGRRDALAESLRRGLRRAGLAHLFAVSGLHVGAMAWLTLRLLGGGGGRLRAILPIVAAGGYTLLVGAPTSAVRAWLMLGLIGLAPFLRRPRSPGNALAVACLVLVSLEPSLSREISFQLTVFATAGILLAMRASHSRSGIRRALAVAGGAAAGTAPVSVPAFSLWPPLGILLNVLAAPWLLACLSTSLVYAAALSWAPLARAISRVLDVLALPLAGLAALPATPLLAVPVTAGALTVLVLVGLAVAAWRRIGPLSLAAPVVLAVLLPRPGERATSAMVVLDVGQGDAIVLQDEGAAMLVDGGGWRSGDFAAAVLLPALAELHVRRLERVVVTHPDRDHCGGLADISFYLPIEEVWSGAGWADDPCVHELTRRARRRRILWRGDRLVWHSWRFEVLHPPPGLRSGRNQRSLVLLAGSRGRTVLLTGDIDGGSEPRVAARLSGPVDVLKVAHHGSRFSTTSRLLAAARPRWALVSVGRRNGYGHPADRVLGELRRAGAWVLRSDLHGRIRLRWREDAPVRLDHTGAAVPVRSTRVRADRLQLLQ